MLSQLPDHTKLCFIVIQNIFNVKTFNVKLCFGLNTVSKQRQECDTNTQTGRVSHDWAAGEAAALLWVFSGVLCVENSDTHRQGLPSLWISMSVTYLSCHVIFIRPSKFHHISCESDGHLGWSCFICVPGQRRAKTQNHLVQDSQEGQQPVIWGGCWCMTFTLLSIKTNSHSPHSESRCLFIYYKHLFNYFDIRKTKLCVVCKDDWILLKSCNEANVV